MEAHPGSIEANLIDEEGHPLDGDLPGATELTLWIWRFTLKLVGSSCNHGGLPCRREASS
jgi:hypothetical protein